MKIGYVRLSPHIQKDQLVGHHFDKVYVEPASAISKKLTFESLMNDIKTGDTVYIQSLDCLVRDLKELKKVIERFEAKKCYLTFLDENLTFSAEPSEEPRFLKNLIDTFVSFQEQQLKERHLDGIKKAKEAGKYKNRKKLTAEQMRRISELLNAKVPKAQIARDLNICRTTLYRYLDV